MTSRPPIRYAVLAAAVVVLALVVGWFARPGTEGLDGDWETAAIDGEVLGPAYVGKDSNVAIDLVTGTRITLGSVPAEATRASGARRLLVLHGTTLDGAGLDGQSRWTWSGPPAHRLSLVAASPRTTVLQACGGTPGGCRLIGIGSNGKESWQTPQPTAAGTAAPVVGADGDLPVVGAFVTEDQTVVLVDPDTSRVVLRPPAAASVGQDGALTLDAPSGSSGRDCQRTTWTTFDRSTTRTLSGPCPAADGDGSNAAAGGDGSDAVGAGQAGSNTGEGTGLPRVRPGRTHAWWWPFGDGRPTLEVSGRHTGKVVGGDPLVVLRVDAEGLTVRDGDVVRRYTWPTAN